MSDSIIPTTYDEWRHCIIVECGLELTSDYMAARIAALQNDKDHYTKQFRKLYGEDHLQRVLGWFQQAQQAA
ncbi:MAG: hypothetical protein AAGA91_14935 [Pseudomonadota bacterium]